MRDDAGFSLIEALVALVIMAGLLALLGSGAATGWRGLIASEQDRRALALAENELARAGIEWPLASGTRSGESGDLTYTIEMRPQGGDGLTQDRGPRVYWVGIEVRWRHGFAGRPRSVRLTTLKMAAPS